MFQKAKKYLNGVLTNTEFSVPGLLGHGSSIIEEKNNKSKKHSKFIEKSCSLLDTIINFILRREGTNKSNEVLRVTWGPLITGSVIMLIFFGIGGVWSGVARLEGAVIAPGEVVLFSHKKTIQHLEGGIISKILVKEGQSVKKGDPLIYFSDVSAKANLGIIKEKLLTSLATEARLSAVRDNLDKIDFPDEIIALSNNETVNKVVEGQEKLFNSYRKTVLGQVDILQQRTKQLEDQLVGLSAQLNAANKQYGFVKEELEVKRKLLDDGHISKPNILMLEKQFADAEGTIGQYNASISQVHQKIGENKLEIINIGNNVQDRTNAELKEINAIISDLKERLMMAEDISKRTVIKASEDGTVTGLKYHTEGGVVPPGAPIMDIVPVGDELIIDSKIQTRNIEEILSAQKKGDHVIRKDGFEGLEVKVRLSAYSARRVGLIKGIVSQVSADAFSEPNGFRYYLVRVVIPKTELSQLKNVYLYPGMPAEVYIVTQSRTPFSYLATPIMMSFEKALRER